MKQFEFLTKERCEYLLHEAQEGSKGVFSAWSQPGQGSGACVLTKLGKTYKAGHMSFPSEGGAHAETLALMIAYQSDLEDPIIAVAIISTKPETRIQFPCGACLQKYVDYIDIISRKKIINSNNHDIAFICGKSNLEYELYSLYELLPMKWKTNR